MTKDLEVSPTEGFIPTKLLTLEGLKMLPSVSVPKAANAKPMELPTPLPEELPLGYNISVLCFLSRTRAERHEMTVEPKNSKLKG